MLRIYSFTAGPADFLRYQSALFEKFVDDEFELIVVADGQDDDTKAELDEAAATLGHRCVRVPFPSCGDPSIGLGDAMDYALAELAHGDELAVFVHGDVFACRPLSFGRLFGDADVIAHPESKVSPDRRITVHYPWSGLVGLRIPALPARDEIRFGPGEVRGVRCDAGGLFELYAARHPELRLRGLRKQGVSRDDAANPLVRAASEALFEARSVELVAGVLLHYLSGSGWLADDRPYRAGKQAAAFDLFDRLLGGAASLGDPAGEDETEPWPGRRQ